MVKVSPSVLSADFTKLEEEINTLEGAEFIHYDVMDGHFVPNISFGYSILSQIRQVTDKVLDVHLMISDPKKYIHEFIKAGSDYITFHIEAVTLEEAKELIDIIHDSGKKAGISIKPNTPVSRISTLLYELDMVLVMSVEPGFGGQSFMDSSLDKIKELNTPGHKYLINVDGGINDETGLLCKNAGADVLVAGSYVFNKEDRKEAIQSLL